MPDLNRVHIMGNLTFDPEIRRIASGTALTELRMAVNSSYKTKDGEDRKDTTYLDVTVWGRQAEFMCEAGRKGHLVFVEGRLKMDSWEDKNTGEKRYKLKVEADRVQLLTKREGDNQNDQRRDDHPQQQGRSQPSRGGYQEQPQQQGRGGAPQGRGGGYAGRGPTAPMTQHEADEDIPFSRPSEFDSNEFFDDVISGPHRK